MKTNREEAGQEVERPHSGNCFITNASQLKLLGNSTDTSDLKLFTPFTWWMSKHWFSSEETKRGSRQRSTILIKVSQGVYVYLPWHSSVRIRNSACPVSDSSLLMEAAEQNWTILGWPDSFFYGANGSRNIQDKHYRGLKPGLPSVISECQTEITNQVTTIKIEVTDKQWV